MKIIDIFENQHPFTLLSNYEVPWKTHISSSELDAEYLFNHSGMKTASNMAEHMFNEDKLIPLMKYCYEKNKIKWDKLWETYSAEYNPIHNYDMDESETIEHTGTISTNTTHTGTDTINTTHTGTVGNSSNTDSKIYPFNSTNATDTDKVNGAITTTNNLTDNSTDTRNLTDNSTDTFNDKNKITRKRAGNLGVTTTQQMSESEFEYREKYDFYEIVFNDLDKILTLEVY